MTHGCIDGYSRLVVFLQTGTTNVAKGVLNLFAQACTTFGLPARVRCDHGGENVDVAIFMTLLRGAERGSVITGKSVHNQRIERLWKDVAIQVTDFFYALFYSFEDDGILDIDDDRHLCALQLVFLPVINARMNAFRKAWNSHRLRTEGNYSPEQLWLDGMLQNARSGYTATAEVFSQTASLDVRIGDALQHFNLDLQQFAGDANAYRQQLSPVSYTVDDGTAEQVRSAIDGMTELKVMFQTAVHMLPRPTDSAQANASYCPVTLSI